MRGVTNDALAGNLRKTRDCPVYPRARRRFPRPKAIMIRKTGGPEVLNWEDFYPGHPGPGESLIRHEAIGLNFIDVYHRSGAYPLPSLPGTIGIEGAGVVEASGPGVAEVAFGDRVAYAGPPRALIQKPGSFRFTVW
jgi:NADPH:quinone reductase-like Zn-dependent oxidoreductase